MSEFDLIEIIRARCTPTRADVALGIGDDAALLRVPAGQELVACTDTLLEGVHFRTGAAPEDIGWKALAVNLSDLAAMGATPAWALLSLALPEADACYVDRFAAGFTQLARKHHVALVGGDTVRGTLSVTLTALGFVSPDRAHRRAGARAGDMLFVTGTLGDAAAGLRCLDRNDPRADALLSAPQGTREALLARLNRPEPRIAAGLALRGIATACIDISDGLLADLDHVCKASGVGAEIELAALPLSSELVALFDADTSRGFVLNGGDDYELCFSAPPDRADRIAADFARLGLRVTRVGRIAAEPGVRVRDTNGALIAPSSRGWDHFAA